MVMPPMGFPSIEQLDRMPAADFAIAVAPLFEGAPPLLDRLAGARAFESFDVLFDRAREIAHSLPEPDQVALVNAHPRLGAAATGISAMSFHEQGYDRDPGGAGEERVAQELERLNDAYEAKLGFRYCVFVAGRSREELLPDMRAALDQPREAELSRALDAVVDIARDRLRSMAVGDEGWAAEG